MTDCSLGKCWPCCGLAELQLATHTDLIRWPSCAVAYVKFPTASEAAKAQEELHQVTIKDGRAPVALKVMIADDPDRHPWDVTR
jgi:hypothetical protein